MRCAVTMATARSSAVSHEATNGVVDQPFRLVTVLAPMGAAGILGCEHRRTLALVRDVTQPLIHSVAQYHAPRRVRGLDEIIRSAGRKMMKEHQFDSGGAAAEQDSHAVIEFLACHQEAVLGGRWQIV